MHPVERILLASIIGVAICGVWIGLTWRAVQYGLGGGSGGADHPALMSAVTPPPRP